MRNATKAVLVVMVLGLAGVAARAGEHCGTSCGTCCASGPTKVIWHVERCEEKYTVPVRVKNPPLVNKQESVRDVPCVERVPVYVKDPCTGCTRTEYQEQTVVKKVKFTTLEVTPPCEEFSCKTEERVRVKTHVSFELVPVNCCCPGQ